MLTVGIDALIVGNADPHHNEYVADRWACRAWLSGMRGSSGTVVVTSTWAGLWTDSRYYEAAKLDLADTEVELMRASDEGVLSIEEWLKAELSEEQTVGFSGADTDLKQARTWVKGFEQVGLKVCSEYDLVDRIWLDRPEAPTGEGC